jgi:arginase family enzyme
MTFKFFRAPLDPDEREQRLMIKVAECKRGYPSVLFRDPYNGVLSALKEKRFAKSFMEVGGLEVEPWLLPAPEPKYVPLLTVECMVAFIDSDGCRDYALKVEEFVSQRVLPGVPVMIGVDHSLTGGCVRSLAHEYGDLALIVLDSHFDAIIPSVRCALIQYDLETNPESPFNPFDPYIYGRVDSYNADSFLYYLVHEGVIVPENLVVLGVSDYPPPHAFKIRDWRVQKYLELYRGFEDMGVKIVKREEVLKNFKVVKEVLEGLKADHFYLSVDLDVGSKSALRGARFNDYEGLDEQTIHRLVKAISRSVGDKLVGLDLMEIDVFNAGVETKNGKDRTYYIAAEIIQIISNEFSKVKNEIK